MNKVFGLLALTLFFAACSTAPLPAPDAGAVVPLSDDFPSLSAADLQRLEADAATGFEDAPSAAEIAAVERELEAGRAVYANDPAFVGELDPLEPDAPTTDMVRPMAVASQVAFVTALVATPLDNFWRLRQSERYRRAHPFADWNTDGCSGFHRAFPVSRFVKGLLDVVWYQACAQHDFGYRSFKKVFDYRNIKVSDPRRKAFVDQRFLDGMRWTCDRKFPGFKGLVLRRACRDAAVRVYLFSRQFGT